MIGWYHEYDKMVGSTGGNITNCTMVSWFDAVNDTLKTYIAGGPSAFDFAVRPGMGLFILLIRKVLGKENDKRTGIIKYEKK